MKNFEIGKRKIGDGEPLAILAGPCVIESEEQTLFIASFPAAHSAALSLFPDFQGKL